MYNRPFRNVYTWEGSASSQTTFSCPWVTGQVTVSNDSSGVNMDLYLGTTNTSAANRRMTLAGGETVSFEIGVREIAISAGNGAVGYRIWILG